MTPDKYVAMLVTSGARKAYISAIKEADLNKKIFEFHQSCKTLLDPLPPAQGFIIGVFPEGLRQDLDSGMPDHHVVVDSTLRYIPLPRARRKAISR